MDNFIGKGLFAKNHSLCPKCGWHGKCVFGLSLFRCPTCNNSFCWDYTRDSQVWVEKNLSKLQSIVHG